MEVGSISVLSGIANTLVSQPCNQTTPILGPKLGEGAIITGLHIQLAIAITGGATILRVAGVQNNAARVALNCDILGVH